MEIMTQHELSMTVSVYTSNNFIVNLYFFVAFFYLYTRFEFRCSVKLNMKEVGHVQVLYKLFSSLCIIRNKCTNTLIKLMTITNTAEHVIMQREFLLPED
jgi:hypothetical protein